MREVLSIFLITLLVSLFLMPFVLKACDREYDYQQAKIKQWQIEAYQEKPLKNFNE